MAKVPFADLTRIHAPLKAEILNRLGSIIDRSAFVLGPEVEAFEKDFASFVGTTHSIGVASGLDALKLALQAIGVGPGDEVITSANTFVATAFAASAVGAKVVLVDVEEDTYNIDPRLLEKAITPRTKAILPVHLYGQPATLGPILEMAKARGIPVIEDACQSHGAKYQGKNSGAIGLMGCFSFYPGKNLGAMGEGGAITTSDDGLKARLRMLRDVGQRKKYDHAVIGNNARIHTFQAAILGAKLPHLAKQNDERVRIAARYRELLGDVRQIVLPKVAADRTHVYHLYVISAEKRDALQKQLGDKGVQTLIHYPVPIHFQECYASLGKGPGSFPVTERLAKSILSLPIFPGMTDAEIAAVASGIREFYGC